MLKLVVSSTVPQSAADMNILLAVCCLLVTGVLTGQSGQSDLSSSHFISFPDLLNPGEANEEFGLEDFANIHMRNVRGTKSRKLKKTEKKTNLKTKGKRRINRKAKKDQKKKQQKNGNKKPKNGARQNKKIPRKTKSPNQAKCQTSSEVDAACIQVRRRESTHHSDYLLNKKIKLDAVMAIFYSIN